ncbi:MAG: ATP-binding cassette domain-containing protein [Acidimicrobiales bacterium]|nr:ATP-binding cassette domain-containing protein [Acidimicrobiales bacterium]
MAGSGTAHLGDPSDALLRVENLHVRFRTGRGTVFAVTDLSIDIRKGETLGLVGESGCGKSTTGRAIMQLPPPTEGSVTYAGDDLTRLHGEDLRRTRTKLQMIFQDPISSLNPRRPVQDIVAEGLRIWAKSAFSPLAIVAAVLTLIGIILLGIAVFGAGIGPAAVFGLLALIAGVGAGAFHLAGFGQPTDPSVEGKVREVLDAVGLDPDVAWNRRPHQFSGGQCQRISIARALVTEPDLIICDEPVSALDVSVQAQILNLLEDLKAQYGLTLVFIAHDLAVVKNVSDRVAVMYLGRICEVGPPDVIYAAPAHPYTRLLLDAIPEPDPDHRGRRAPEQGELPSPLAPPSGCHFRTRCPRADERCAAEVPLMAPTGDGRFVACHHPLVETAVAVASTPVG